MPPPWMNAAPDAGKSARAGERRGARLVSGKPRRANLLIKEDFRHDLKDLAQCAYRFGRRVIARFDLMYSLTGASLEFSRSRQLLGDFYLGPAPFQAQFPNLFSIELHTFPSWTHTERFRILLQRADRKDDRSEIARR